ncbi:MAG TPA: PIN domain-containing protein [Bryobacteraceae bacterium]|nr:PIN domain-containing protein [Bryobacteraceae bacterium]
MALIADSGAIYALYDSRDRHHAAVVAMLDESETIILPMAILAEIDYLLRVRLGNRAVLRFLEGIQSGGYLLEPLTATDLIRCVSLIQTHADLNLGLADASVIATADRLDVARILTVDERHFRAIRSSKGSSFKLFPADG